MDTRHHGTEVRLLGPPEVVVGGRRITIGSDKQLALLVALALDAGVIVSAPRLVEALWGEDPPESAVPTLRGLVSRLRKTLAAGGEEAVTWLCGGGSGYVLELGPDEIDSAHFECLAAAGRDALVRADPAGAADALRQGLRLWRGPALGDLAGRPFFGATAGRLDEARLGATEDLAEAELALGRPGDALTRLEPHVAVNPLRERAWGQLMLALYRLGRQADALRAYQRVRHVLAEELGIEPTPALRDLEAGILQHSPDLILGPADGPGGVASGVRPRDFGDTVVFLFTDIESSTRRWEGDQESMAANLARHDTLLGEACATWGGRVFSHTGDGLCAAFPTAAAAIGAAVAGQGALAGEPWAPDDPLRVRMAVHVGAAECRAGNYFGPTLNRTARLLAGAWGGQIVCSAAAADLAADQLPEGISLVDLGEQRLADLARPERVFQVAQAALPAEFPPLRTAGAPRHNLPAALTSFVGRGEEIQEVVRLLGRSRLVTLAGPGGAGKTRLALEAAAVARERFPEGAWLAELAPVRDPTLVAPEVAAALGLDPSALASSGRPFNEALCDQLRHRRLLIVMDNCEHLVGAAATLAHAILTHCPDIVVLATSREVLAVPGEAVVRVGPLSLPPPDVSGYDDLTSSDAATLFCERVREASFGFVLTAANAAHVARICRRLDGIPLALELAAARIPLLGARQLAERLDDRFRLLAAGPRTADPRHQTLQAAIDWSYDLLPEAERTVLRRLAVFPSDFSLEAAEAVAAGSDAMDGPDGLEVLGIVGRLADKSLLVASLEDTGSTVRYRLLETVRQYAAGKLDNAGESDTIRDRHRSFFTPPEDWFLHLSSGRSLRWAETEADNVRAALEWSREQNDSRAILRLAAPQYLYWYFAGVADAAEWLDRAVAAPGHGDVLFRVHARLGLALIRGTMGTPGSDLLRREALTLALDHGDELAAAVARRYIASAAAAEGHFQEAESLISEAIETLPSGPHRVIEARRLNFAVASMSLGNLSLAREHGERALALIS